MAARKKQSMLNGAFILIFFTLVVKVIGAIFKMPLTNIITNDGRGYFSTAYDLYTSIYAISMVGLPIALSRLISQNIALHRFRDVKKLFKIAIRLYTIIGVIGMVALLLIARPYATSVVKSPDAMLCMVALAPSIFFCCIMSAYRGYYEGMSNMFPTGLSQMIEALVKLVVGLVLAKFIMDLGMNQYAAKGSVFGIPVANQEEALNKLYPFAAAGAILGVTVGTLGSLIYLALRHKFRGNDITQQELALSPPAASNKNTLKRLAWVALPLILSAFISNITNLIDSATIQNRLAHAVVTGGNTINPVIESIYEGIIPAAKNTIKLLPNYLWGCYNTALDFKNLIPTITISIGVSALPALSSAWTLKDKPRIRTTIESTLRLTTLITLPVGFGMAVLPKQILDLVYADTAIAAPILRVYGASLLLIAISGPLASLLQAIGRTDVTVKSVFIGGIIKVILNYVLIGTPSINIQGAPYSTLFCYIAIVGYNLFFLIKATKMVPNMLRVFIRPLLAALCCGFAAWAGYGLLSRIIDGKILTILAIGVAGIVYVLALFLFRAISREDVLMLPKGEKIAERLEKYRLIS